MPRKDATICLTAQETREIMEILRHISTSNREIQDAQYRLYHTLHRRLVTAQTPLQTSDTK